MNEKMLFTIVFLLIFFVTAMATVMGAAKIRPFHNMSERWVKILIGPLIVELAVAVIAVFVSLYEVKVEKYTFEVKYRDFLSDWRKTISSSDEKCIQVYIDAGGIDSDVKKECIDIVQVYIRKEKANNETGVGSIYLEHTDHTYSGMAFYEFPGEKSATVFRITGAESDNKIPLSFIQQQGYYISDNGGVGLRPASSFPVEFKMLEDQEDVFEGKIVGKDLVYYGLARFY